LRLVAPTQRQDHQREAGQQQGDRRRFRHIGGACRCGHRFQHRHRLRHRKRQQVVDHVVPGVEKIDLRTRQFEAGRAGEGKGKHLLSVNASGVTARHSEVLSRFLPPPPLQPLDVSSRAVIFHASALCGVALTSAPQLAGPPDSSQQKIAWAT
jgi:hypothetical protein